MRKTRPVVGLVLCALIVGLGQWAMAAGTVGDFEVDGNRPDDLTSAPLDWSSVPDVKGFNDTVGARDDVYKDGSKALQPGGWGCATKKAPAKDDIVSAAIALRKVGTERFMYVNWQRASTNGTANVDYEFSQSNQDVPGCPGLPQRTDGDIILVFNFDNGGGAIVIEAYRWRFTGPGVGVYEPDPASLIEGDTYDAAVNPGGSPPANEGNLAMGAFGEASINLTRTFGDICPKFASAYVRTRTSTSITSDPKDRTAKRSDLCPPPNPTIRKTARSSAVEVGGQVTFDIAYGNTGDGTAIGATISDTLPTGTSFVSCTGGCTQSGNTVTWQVGPVAPGGGGTVSLTLRMDTIPSGCTVCNTATIDSPQKVGSPDASSEVCIRVGPGPAPDTASANGQAIGVHIGDTGFGIDRTITDVASSRVGDGVDSQDGSAATIRIPTSTLSPPVVQLDVIAGVATSQVLTATDQARQVSAAQVVGLNLLNGVIRADVVRAAALAEATSDGAFWNTAGSGFVNLYIDADGAGLGKPQLYDNASPGLVVDLTSLFGKGPKGERSGVMLREVSGSTTGTYQSDVTVTMIHVIAWDRDPLQAGRQTTDIYVSRAIAHAQHPSMVGCPGAVSGNAYIASVTTDPELVPILVGPVEIPQYGGHDEQALNQLFIPSDGSVLTSELLKSVSDGTLGTSSAHSNDYAEIKNLCVLKGTGSSGCLVGATLVRSEATSDDTSSGGASSTDAGTQFVTLTVLGTPISVPVNRNTTISLGALGFITLNEQWCDDGDPLNPGPVPTCGGTGHSGLTVRAIRVVLLDPPAGGLPGVEVIVAHAHSDATAP